MKAARSVETRKVPPLPDWFQARVTLQRTWIQVESQYTQFRLHSEAAVLGRGGFFLFASLPLQEGTDVHLDVSCHGYRFKVPARVEKSLAGLGTMFRFRPGRNWLARQWALFESL